MVVYPLFYLFHTQIYGAKTHAPTLAQKLAVAYHTFHYAKRIFETFFIHEFSKGAPCAQVHAWMDARMHACIHTSSSEATIHTSSSEATHACMHACISQPMQQRACCVRASACDALRRSAPAGGALLRCCAAAAAVPVLSACGGSQLTRRTLRLCGAPPPTSDSLCGVASSHPCVSLSLSARVQARCPSATSSRTALTTGRVYCIHPPHNFTNAPLSLPRFCTPGFSFPPLRADASVA